MIGNAEVARSANQTAKASRRRDDRCQKIAIDKLVPEIGRIEEKVMATTFDHATALQAVLDAICSVENISGAAVALVGDEGLVWSASSGTAPRKGTVVEAESPLFLEPLSTGRFARCDNIISDTRVSSELLAELRFRSAAVLPLWSSGSHFGVLAIFSDEPRTFGDCHVIAFGTCGTVAAFLAAQAQPADITAPTPVVRAAAPPIVLNVAEQHENRAPEPEFDYLAILQQDSASAATPTVAAGVMQATRKAPIPTRNMVRLGLVAVLVLSFSSLVFSRVLAARRTNVTETKVAQVAARGVVAYQQGTPRRDESRVSNVAVRPGLIKTAPLPSYPSAALQSATQGEVIAELRITPSGVVDSVELKSGDSMFTSGAVSALAHWHFSPFLVDGRPVAVNLPITVTYRIER